MTAATKAPPRTNYRVKAMSVEACSCAHGCNCQFGGTPNEGKCEFIIGYQIHEGHGHVVLFVDQRARPEQVEAIATIFSGQMGGMPWEALAGTIEKFEGPLPKPIDMAIHGQQAHVRIPGEIELE